MASVPREWVDNLSRMVSGISERSQRMLAEELATIDLTDMDAVLEVMNRWCAISTDAAALANANFYELVRALQTGEYGYEASVESGRIEEATEVATKGARKQSGGDAARFVVLLQQRLDYETRRAAGDNTFINGSRDRRRPRYARVPTGAETCLFCLMLASRGFVYHSELSAGALDHYHANCDCRVVPGFNGSESSVAGYDPQRILERWRDGVDELAEERAERHGTTFKEERAQIMQTYADSARAASRRR